MNLSSLGNQYRESRPFNTLVNILGFCNDTMFLTKSGELGLVLECRGQDSECLEAGVKEAALTTIRSALNVFDENFTFTQYLLKQSAPDVLGSEHPNPIVKAAIANRAEFLRSKGHELYSFETYLVVICRPAWRPDGLGVAFTNFLRAPKEAFRKSFTRLGAAGPSREALEAAERLLIRSVTSFTEQIAEHVTTRRLTKGEAFTFFRRLLNPCPLKARAAPFSFDTHVDFFITDSELECHRNHLRLDDYFVKVLTLKQPPAHTHADFLRQLLRVHGNVTVTLEWKPLDSAKAVSLIQSKRRHFHNSKVSMFSGVLSDRPYEREMLFDDSKEALAVNLGHCLEEIELKGLRLGDLTLTVTLTGKSEEQVERSVAEVMRVVGTYEGAMTEERYNGLNAFLASRPGGQKFNLRQHLATNLNYVDCGFWFLPAEGEKRCSFLGAESLIPLETEEGSLYYYPLHVGDTGHTLIVGPTGSGKSFDCNAFLTHAQKYNPMTLILDVGGSYRWLTTLFGGSYIEVRPDSLPFAINPFSLSPTPRNLEYLHSFWKAALQLNGCELTDDDDQDLFKAIEALYVLEPEQRRALTLSTTVNKRLGKHLKRWTEGQQDGRYFDRWQDTVRYEHLQCIDFAGMERNPVVFELLLSYLLFRADDFIYDPKFATTPKIIVADEAWRFMKHPLTRAYLLERLKTGRKNNLALVLSTQSVEDLSGVDALKPIVDNCPTKLLLANPTLSEDVYGEILGLTSVEQERVRRLVPKRQFLMKREKLSKVLNLNVDPKSYWLFTTNPYEAKRRQEVLKTHCLEEALELLAKGTKE